MTQICHSTLINWSKIGFWTILATQKWPKATFLQFLMLQICINGQIATSQMGLLGISTVRDLQIWLKIKFWSKIWNFDKNFGQIVAYLLVVRLQTCINGQIAALLVYLITPYLTKNWNYDQFLKPILAKSRNQTNSEQNSDQELPIWRKFGYLWTRIWLKYQILAVFGPKCGQNIKFWEVDLTKKLLTDLFIGEINFTEKWANNNICCFCDQKFREINVTTLLWQKFRENNVFTTEDTKQLIWRNFLMGDSKFFIFPHCALLLCDQKFREINVITKLQSTLHFIWFDGFFLHRIFHEETE